MANLSILAGHKAFARLQREGFSADAVQVVAGAAGGAKWLSLSQLDRAIFGSFLRVRHKPLFLLGSSIGAWRFAAVSQRDPLAAIDRFEEAYIMQSYRPKPTPAEVSATSSRIMDSFLAESAIDEVLDHPQHRISMLSVRARGLVAREGKLPLGLGLGVAGLSNMVHPKGLQLWFDRTLFVDPRSSAPFQATPRFKAKVVTLSRANFRAALMASGSIPLVMEGVRDIPNAPAGVYRDGGLIDYHLNVPFLESDRDDVVLFPHFGEKIIPGWFDKSLPWRRPQRDFMSHVLLLAPSPTFIDRLPLRKIPDRSDFIRFQGYDAERRKYWRKVIAECERLADEFRDCVSRDRFSERVRPLPLQ